MASTADSQFWHLEYSVEDDYRIVPDASDNWIGILCNEGADEVVDLTDFFVEGVRFEWVKELAKALCGAHAIVFNLRSTQYPEVREEFLEAIDRFPRYMQFSGGEHERRKLSLLEDCLKAHDDELP